MGRMSLIVIYDLVSKAESAFCSQVASCIGIHVKTREITAADINPHMVASLEQIGGWVERKLQLVDLAFLHQLWSRPAVAITSAQN